MEEYHIGKESFKEEANQKYAEFDRFIDELRNSKRHLLTTIDCEFVQKLLDRRFFSVRYEEAEGDGAFSHCYVMKKSTKQEYCFVYETFFRIIFDVHE